MEENQLLSGKIEHYILGNYGTLEVGEQLNKAPFTYA